MRMVKTKRSSWILLCFFFSLINNHLWWFLKISLQKNLGKGCHGELYSNSQRSCITIKGKKLLPCNLNEKNWFLISHKHYFYLESSSTHICVILFYIIKGFYITEGHWGNLHSTSPLKSLYSEHFEFIMTDIMSDLIVQMKVAFSFSK